MKRIILPLFFSTLLFLNVSAQQNNFEAVDFGVEVRLFQRGWSPSLELEYPLDVNGNHVIQAGVSMYQVDMGDFGRHINETGTGYGIGLGYRYYINDFAQGFFLGVRTDYWWANFDYKDEIIIDGSTVDIVDNSKVQLFMPSMEMGYKFLVDNAKMHIRPSLSYGLVNNVVVEGNEIGEENFIFIALSFGFRL